MPPLLMAGEPPTNAKHKVKKGLTMEENELKKINTQKPENIPENMPDPNPNIHIKIQKIQ